MTTAVALQQATDFALVAVDKPQLEAAHAQMIAWATQRQAQCDTELAAERENLRIAEERKWATAPFRRRITVLEKRRVFYEKIEIALHAGYVIIPNFAMNIFAIRTNADAPRAAISESRWATFPQSAQRLPPGHGEYKNPLPTVMQESHLATDGDKNIARYSYMPGDFQDVEFPITLAKPELMGRTAEAMSMRLFDEIGVAVDAGSGVGRGKGDPIIIGRIRNPRDGRPDISFFIGWYFDPTRL